MSMKTLFSTKSGLQLTGSSLCRPTSMKICEEMDLLKWPSRSPDMTPSDFLLWGHVNVPVYVPPLPANKEQLMQRITTELQTASQDMLHRVWEELEYRIDVYRVSSGAHMEHS